MLIGQSPKPHSCVEMGDLESTWQIQLRTMICYCYYLEIERLMGAILMLENNSILKRYTKHLSMVVLASMIVSAFGAQVANADPAPTGATADINFKISPSYSFGGLWIDDLLATDEPGMVVADVDGLVSGDAFDDWGFAYLSLDSGSTWYEMDVTDLALCNVVTDGLEVDEIYKQYTEYSIACPVSPDAAVLTGANAGASFTQVVSFKGSYMSSAVYAENASNFRITIGGDTGADSDAITSPIATSGVWNYIIHDDDGDGDLITGFRSNTSFALSGGPDGTSMSEHGGDGDDEIWLKMTSDGTSSSDTPAFEVQTWFVDNVSGLRSDALDHAEHFADSTFGVCIANVLDATTSTIDQCSRTDEAVSSIPNAFSTTSSSWVSVEASERVYFDPMGWDHDDTEITYLPEGASCEYFGSDGTRYEAQGPALVGDGFEWDARGYSYELNSYDCVSGDGSTPYDPADVDSRTGASPIGFPVNFFGDTYTDLYFSENGTVYFDSPSGAYDMSLASISAQYQTSVISPFGVDLYFDLARSVIWTAQTTIGSRQAFVISWENLAPYAEDAVERDAGTASFQLVLINQDAGDFTAYLNYAEIQEIYQGYNRGVLLDLNLSLQNPNTNIYTAQASSNSLEIVAAEGECVPLAIREVFISDDNGQITDEPFYIAISGAYIKVIDSQQQTFSLWSDSSCTGVANEVVATSPQDLENDGPAYLLLSTEGLNQEESAGIGWATLDSSSGLIQTTEFFENVDNRLLFDGADLELISYSYNTNVPGRIVIGQHDGVTQLAPESGSRVAASKPYAGPVIANIIPNFAGTDETKVSGLRLETVTSVEINNMLLPQRLDSNGDLYFDTSSIVSGSYAVRFWSAVESITLLSEISIVTKSSTRPTQKVNAGSFKGYVAVYAKGYEGHRLSAKVGKDWVIVPSIPAATNDLYRHVEFTGAGVDVAVRIYIDRVLVDTINLTTK